ncbi:MAG: helix-turn-helix domain-containing protein, partial [Bacteroidota bacterium]
RTYVMKVIYWTWTAGVAAAAVVLWPVFRRWGKWTTQELWLVNVFAANFLVHLAYRTVSYTSYIVGALSFSCVFYLLGVWYVLWRREADFLVRERPKYGGNKVTPDAAADLVERCRRVMEEEKLYLRSDLKLIELAQAVDSTPHELSQVLNDRLEQRFTDYLRGYRVRQAQAAILTDDHLTLEAIGREAGFGSKSAFYAAFREVTGMTPAQHRRGRSSAR